MIVLVVAVIGILFIRWIIDFIVLVIRHPIVGVTFALAALVAQHAVNQQFGHPGH